jgi:hypothetical protein
VEGGFFLWQRNVTMTTNDMGGKSNEMALSGVF